VKRHCFLLVCVAGVVLASMPARPATGPLEGIPRYDHIAIVVLENENYDTSWGPGSVAHYLNSLRGQGVFADHYYATGHVSLDNYIAMVSGQPWNPVTGSDCLAVNLWVCVQMQRIFRNGRNIADKLEEHGLTWKGYMDGMPSPCFHGDYSPLAPPPDPYQGDSNEPPAFNYADRHNPFIYFPNIIENEARCKAHDVPYTQLAADLAADNLPTFSFITPDTCNDGHDAPCADGRPGGLTTADLWLSNEMPPLIDYLRSHNGLLIVTFDENGFSDTENIFCCRGGPGPLPGFGGKIGLVAVGVGVTPGKVVHSDYDHMSLLRTLEDAFGMPGHLNGAAGATPMSDLFTP
jgi:phosphatidylinositol-3-phosphatase